MASLTELHAFFQFAEGRIGQPEFPTLEVCLTRFREIESLRQALAEIEAMTPAAAGCGYSRDEIAAQYRDRIERLLQ